MNDPSIASRRRVAAMLAFDIYEHPDHVHHGAIAAAFVVETSMAALPWSNARWLSGQ